MGLANYAVMAGQLVTAVALVMLAAYLGRRAARAVGQPEVIAEITAGLLAAPVIMAAGGRRAFALLLPGHLISALHLVGSAALALFLVGVAHSLREFTIPSGRTLARTVAGSLLFPLACGAGFASWVIVVGGPALRGSKPAAALVLLLGAGMAITAVPVLARFLIDAGLVSSEVGRLALATAMVTDVFAWLLLALALAVGAAAGLPGSLIPLLVALTATALAAVSLSRLLRTGPLTRFARRFPGAAAVAVAVAAVASSVLTRHAGLTEVSGPLAIGLALPASPPWIAAAHWVSRLGSRLVPVFFVATGIGVVTGGRGFPWIAVLLATGLATMGKVLGAYAGARSAGRPPGLSLRLGVLLNTRGLTELVVLQAGYGAGILSAQLYVALIVMAVLTTAMTGPAYRLLSLRATRSRPAAAPAADFRALMAAFPSGVAILTTTDDGGTPHGMTVSSICSVAMAPPTLLVCLRKGSPTLEAVVDRTAFTVNLLHDRAKPVAELFASGVPDRFERVAWRRDDSAAGPHLAEHAHAIADCAVTGTTPVGDHVVVFGQVTRVARSIGSEPATPLLYGLRQYSSWPATQALQQ